MAQKRKSTELAEIIRRQIASGQFSIGQQLEAISGLAERYGTTVATVSKALEALEQAGYVERFPGKGVFVKAKSTCHIAVVIDIDFYSKPMPGTFFPLFIDHLDRKCSELNWTYQLFFNVVDQASAKNFMLQLNQNRFDAVLVASRWLAENCPASMTSCSSVFIGLCDYKWLDLSVSFDPVNPIADAVKALAAQGCSQIAFMSSDQDKSWHRLESRWHLGYLQGLREIDKLYDSSLDWEVPLTLSGGMSGFYELIRHKTANPMGIVIADSVITLGVIQGILSIGMKIPEDIIIATHTNAGNGLTDFAFPVIKLQYSIEDLLGYIINLIDGFMEGRTIEKKVHFVKVSLSNPFTGRAGFKVPQGASVKRKNIHKKRRNVIYESI